MSQIHRDLSSSPTLTLEGEDQTAHVARILSGHLRQDDMIALEGDLGAGKTLFARALIRAYFGDDRIIPSPTFTLLQSYEGKAPLVLHHIDCYRLDHERDLEPLDIDDLGRNGALIVEWANLFRDFLLARYPNTLEVVMDRGESECVRQLHFRPHGMWCTRLKELVQDVTKNFGQDFAQDSPKGFGL